LSHTVEFKRLDVQSGPRKGNWIEENFVVILTSLHCFNYRHSGLQFILCVSLDMPLCVPCIQIRKFSYFCFEILCIIKFFWRGTFCTALSTCIYVLCGSSCYHWFLLVGTYINCINYKITALWWVSHNLGRILVMIA
jgi:hypothetical protein